MNSSAHQTFLVDVLESLELVLVALEASLAQSAEPALMKNVRVVGGRIVQDRPI